MLARAALDCQGATKIHKTQKPEPSTEAQAQHQKRLMLKSTDQLLAGAYLSQHHSMGEALPHGRRRSRRKMANPNYCGL
jgi:hypothetical protein